MFFNLFIILIDFDNLFANLFMWLFQFKYLSIVMPKKLNSSTHSNSDPKLADVPFSAVYRRHELRFIHT